MPSGQPEEWVIRNCCYYGLGLDREAIRLQEQVRDYYLAARGPEHPYTLNAICDLAISYDRAGLRAEALKMQEQNLATSRRVRGAEAPDTLKVMRSLAILYTESGRHAEAVKMEEQALGFLRKISGPEHPDTLEAMNDLGGIYFEAGRKEEGRAILKQAVALERKINGPEHPTTLTAELNLAQASFVLGQTAEALLAMEELVPLDRKVKGAEHPETLIAMYDLSACYYESGQREKAVRLLEETLALSIKVKGLGHIDVERGSLRLATLYCSVGRGQDAITVLERLLERDPHNTLASLKLATLLAWFGSEAGYDAMRRFMLQLAEGGTQAATAERAAKAFCLLPCGDAVWLKRALALAQRAVDLEPANPWLLLARGMAEYRIGLYLTAEQTLSRAIQKAGQFQDLEGTAHLFKCLSVLRQGRHAEALDLFRQGQSGLPPFPTDEDCPFADIKSESASNHDLLIWWLAYKEAKHEMSAEFPLGEPSGSEPAH